MVQKSICVTVDFGPLRATLSRTSIRADASKWVIGRKRERAWNGADTQDAGIHVGRNHNASDRIAGTFRVSDKYWLWRKQHNPGSYEHRAMSKVITNHTIVESYEIDSEEENSHVCD